MATAAALNCRACNLRPTLILRSSSERGAISRSADTSKIAQEQQHHHHVVVTGSKCIETRQTRSVGPTTNGRTGAAHISKDDDGRRNRSSHTEGSDYLSATRGREQVL